MRRVGEEGQGDLCWWHNMMMMMIENYKNTLRKQNEYEKLLVNEKLKHENKNIKCNCKPLFKYVKSKTKIHKTFVQ